MLDGLGDAEVGHAGLGGDGAVLPVDVEDPVELAQAQDDAVGERQGTARERGPGPARHDLDLLGVAEAQDRRDLLGRGRQHHGHGHGAVGGEPVALVGAQLGLAGDHALARHDLAQGRDHALALGQHLGVGLGHQHGGAPWWMGRRMGREAVPVNVVHASSRLPPVIESARSSAGRIWFMRAFIVRPFGTKNDKQGRRSTSTRSSAT